MFSGAGRESVCCSNSLPATDTLESHFAVDISVDAMKSSLAKIVLVVTFCCAMSAGTVLAETLDIYFIDVEGGQSTLIVTPGGEALLIDAGFASEGGRSAMPGDPSAARDAQRILAATGDAGVSRIDYALVTHFHRDHFGGFAELSQLISIGTFIDHDTAAPEAVNREETRNAMDAYLETRAQSEHIIPAAGDQLPLRNIDVTIVSTDGATLASPLTGAGELNSACNRAVLAAGEPYENPRSTGILLKYGEFRFLDVGDLTGQPLSDLVCPTDKIGQVDVYLVTHHGGADAADHATLTAFQPRVAVLNNGARKGGAAVIFDFLRDAEEIDDVWQIHRSEAEGAVNFSDDRIANLDEETAHWIKLSANSDGSFRIQNGRTGEWANYDVE